jgi:large subunit ribosomal protein L10
LTLGLNLDDKKAVVAEVSAEVANAQSIIVAEYRGLEVVDLTALRATARKSGVYLRVLKNTLVRRAVAGTPFEGLVREAGRSPDLWNFQGSGGRRQAAQRLCQEQRQAHHQGRRNAQLRHGRSWCQGAGNDAEPRGAASKLLGTMQAPITQFVRTLNEVPTKFVRGLAAVRDAKEAA